MGLPYERQILRLLQELSHYQVVVRHCRQEKAKYTEELEKTCREIEQAVYEMEEKQQAVLSQWRKINEQERSRIIFPVVNGVEKMAEYATDIQELDRKMYEMNQIMNEYESKKIETINTD